MRCHWTTSHARIPQPSIIHYKPESGIWKKKKTLAHRWFENKNSFPLIQCWQEKWLNWDIWLKNYVSHESENLLLNTLRPNQNVCHFPDDNWNKFSWMKMLKLLSRIHWSLFPRFKSTIFQPWFRKWLDTDQATSHYLNQWLFVYWCIYASLSLNEFNLLWPSVVIWRCGS